MCVDRLARLLGVARAVFGLAFLVDPRGIMERWAGPSGREPAARAAARALGARDLAIGTGTLAALRDGADGQARQWLTAGIVADLADLAVTLRTDRPARTRALISGLAGGGAATGWLVRARLGH